MTDLDHTITKQWDSGALGRDAAHAIRAPAEAEAIVDRALAMKLVTIRLPVPMIDALKTIADFYGIGYQPMVRDLLHRFVRSELRTILDEMHQQAEETPSENTAPVDNFMQRRVARG